jgi:hypothetical protein
MGPGQTRPGRGRHREGGDARADQRLARLFIECGWTQHKIAERMGWSQTKVARQLLFGRFLGFMPNRHNLESLAKPLTEWRFRQNWATSGKRRKETEPERFARVQELLATDTSETPRGYGQPTKGAAHARNTPGPTWQPSHPGILVE